MKGTVVEAQGNLVTIDFEGDILQNEVIYVNSGGKRLKGEVIEVSGNRARAQIFEITKGITYGDKVELTHDLVVAELGPGILTRTFDGLQNPLHLLAEEVGYFLERGTYLPPLPRDKVWEWTPTASIGEVMERGETLGTVPEAIFKHKIMLPFELIGRYTVSWLKEPGSYDVDEVIARVTNDRGEEIEITMAQKWPVKKILRSGERVLPEKPLITGMRIVDTYYPVCRGGTYCVPGPFGSGKTVLQQLISRYAEVDIVIIVACGERAGEVVETIREFPELIDPRTGNKLIERTCIICNTSSMPVAARESSVYIGMTLAEYYRQMGLDVLVLADSTSRWAQALREMSGRLEEIPGEEAFPAYLASRIFELYERAGQITTPDGSSGSVTLGGNVSPAGGNFEEPVTQSTLAVVGCFHGLSYDRSYARRYPAIDPIISWSKYLDQGREHWEKLDPEWIPMVLQAREVTVRGDEINKRMQVVGEEGTAMEDFVTYLKSEFIDGAYLQQNAFDAVDAYCPIDRQIETFKLIIEILNNPFGDLAGHDRARAYFQRLTAEYKHLNTLPFRDEQYNEQMRRIVELVERYRDVDDDEAEEE